jgi:hypothetical protein
MGFVDNIIAVAVYVVERSEGAMTKPLSRTKTHVRCGSPDCEWGVPFSGFSERQLDRCRREFRQHCIDRHGLCPDDTERICWFDCRRSR